MVTVISLILFGPVLKAIQKTDKHFWQLLN